METTIKPQLHQLITILMEENSVPSILNLVKRLDLSESKIRTLLKDLLHFKFIYTKSSSGYAINQWTQRILSFDFNIEENATDYILETQTKSYMKINKELFNKLFKFRLTDLDTITSVDVLYFFITLSKEYKSIHKNSIEVKYNKMTLNILIIKYKTEERICDLHLYFDKVISWNS